MNYVGWTLTNVTDEERAPLAMAIRARACEVFYLCATVGCRCIVGRGKKVCKEGTIGGRFPLWSSEGPNWSLSVRALSNALQIDCYFDLPAYGIEVSNFHTWLVSLGKPLAIQTGIRSE